MQRSIRYLMTAGLAAMSGALPAQMLAQSGSAAVDTKMSIYLAGGNTYTIAPPNGGGLSPFEILLTAGTGRVLRVDASGTAVFCDLVNCPTSSPDGPSIGGTNLTASGSISGILAPTSGFLAGVFLGASLPGAAPTSLDFGVLGTSFASLSGLQLGQQFFIGNGFTSGNVQQLFFVPDGATRLYLGIADGGSFQGNPNFYNDNLGIYTARYNITQDETGLAVVMGHEIAHAVAKHGSERMSQGLVQQLGGQALSVALSTNAPATQQLALQAFGVGSQLGLLRYGRNQETEADHLGLIFMAMAGYNPDGAITFWQRMDARENQASPPEFLSTHPSNGTRIADIQRELPEARKYYSAR